MPLNREAPTLANDTWHLGAAYERYMGRWSRQLALRFVDVLAAPPALRWLDVGCGTGALSAAIDARCAPCRLTGIDPSAGFIDAARHSLPPEVRLHVAPAEQLPLADAQVDLCVSALVLNFVRDADAALREMVRVTAPGGRIAACVWDYAQKMELVRHYWDTAAQLALLGPGQDQAERFPICAPEALADAFDRAGLAQVQVSAIEIEMEFADFDDYWDPFLGGQGPAPAHAMRLTEADRGRMRSALRSRLPARSDGSIHLAARAWAAVGARPG